jgi:hypothetical protein
LATKKQPKENNRPNGDNSPNLVAMVEGLHKEECWIWISETPLCYKNWLPGTFPFID